MNKNVTVVPVDNLIIVDGEPLVFSFPADPNIHAVQWSGGLRKGHVEIRDYSPHILLNDETDYNEHVAPFVKRWEERKAWLQTEQERLQAELEAETGTVGGQEVINE